MTAHKFAKWSFILWIGSIVANVIYASMNYGDELPVPTGLLFLGAFSGLLYDWSRTRGASEDRALFLSELSSLLRMGMSTKQALEILSGTRQREFGHRFSEFGKVVIRVAERVESGSTLPEAFEESKGCPSAWTVYLEQLEEPDEVADLLQNMAKLERRTLILPVFSMIRLFILVVLITGITIFLRTYIMPTFVELFKGMNLQMMWTTRALVTGESGNGASLLLTLVLWVVILAVAGWVSGVARRPIMRAALYVPGVRDLIKFHCQSRVYAALANGLRAGASSDLCFREAAKVAEIQPYVAFLLELEASGEPSVASGLSRKPQLFSPASLWLIEQGEHLENLPEALETASTIAASALNERAKRAVANLDTFLLLGIGAFVGVVVVSVFLPMYQLIGNLG